MYVCVYIYIYRYLHTRIYTHLSLFPSLYTCISIYIYIYIYIYVCIQYIPKKPVAHHHDIGDVYAPEGTRPLSIVDTSNRILANAFRHRWEPQLAQWISPAQRGFLPGRSILANVVDIEEASVLAALQEDEYAVSLFDFAAAFPSVSQDYLLRALEHIGLPPHALHAIRAFYDNNRCRLAFGGQLWGGVPARGGDPPRMPTLAPTFCCHYGPVPAAPAAQTARPVDTRIRR